jgi:hypothetical protein
MRSLSTRATGLLILALGVWGGLIPFIGHYLHFALGPDKAWSWTSGRLYLSVIPGAVAVFAGLNLISAGPRGSARFGALLALLAGIWFAIGPDVSFLWNHSGALGSPHGSRFIRVLELVTYHTGLGALMAALAGYALPRFPRRAVVADTATGAGAGVAGYEATHAHEPVAAREPVARHEPVATEPDGTREPTVAEERAVDRGEPAEGDVPAANRAYPEDAPVSDRGDYAEAPTSGGYAADAGGTEYPSETAPADRTTQYASDQPTTAGAAPTATRTRRSGGLLSAFRRR